MNYLEKLRYLEYYAYRINKQKGARALSLIKQ
jgi:hypothetical protein